MSDERGVIEQLRLLSVVAVGLDPVLYQLELKGLLFGLFRCLDPDHRVSVHECS